MSNTNFHSNERQHTGMTSKPSLYGNAQLVNPQNQSCSSNPTALQAMFPKNLQKPEQYPLDSSKVSIFQGDHNLKPVINNSRGNTGTDFQQSFTHMRNQPSQRLYPSNQASAVKQHNIGPTQANNQYLPVDQTEYFTAHQYQMPAANSKFSSRSQNQSQQQMPMQRGGHFQSQQRPLNQLADEQSTSKPSHNQAECSQAMGQVQQKNGSKKHGAQDTRLALNMLQENLVQVEPWDLFEQSKTTHCDYQPFSDIPAESTPLPYQLQREKILCSHIGSVTSSPNYSSPLIYFGSTNSLYVWDGRQQTCTMELSHKPLCIYESRCLNPKAVIQSKFKSKQEIILLVGLENGEIKLCKVIRNVNMQLKISCFETIETGAVGNVTKICQLEKNGRLFYTGNNPNEGGTVHEIKFEDLKGTYQTLFTSQTKRIVQIDHEKSGAIISTVKSMFFLKAKAFVVADVIIDQQRNILYCHKVIMCEKTEKVKETEVHCYDLGALGEDFSLFAKITQKEIANQITESKDEVSHCKISKIFSISPCNSVCIHLMLLTERNERIYISFDEISETQAQNYSDKIIQSKGLQQEQIISKRFKSDWKVIGVQKMPSVKQMSGNHIAEVYYHDGFVEPQEFAETNSLDMATLMNFSQYDSTLSYQVQNNQNSLIVASLRTNQGKMQELKIALENGHNYIEPPQKFNFINILSNSGNQSQIDSGFNNLNMTNATSERLLEISSFEAQPSAKQPTDYQQLMSYLPDLQSVALWGRENQYQKFKQHIWSSIECQVYQELPFCSKLLTTERLIKLVSPRPIDILVMALQSKNLQVFWDFCQDYTLLATCSMLIQILSADESARYLIVKRLVKAMRNRYNAQFIQQYHQIQNSGNSNQGRISKPRSTLIQQQMMSQLSRPSHHSSMIQNNNQQPEWQREQQHHMQDLASQLHSFDLSSQREVEEHLGDGELKKMASQMLRAFGDCVQINQIIAYENYLQNFVRLEQVFEENKLEEHLAPMLLSIKHEAICNHLRRVMRPIWQLSLVALQNASNPSDAKQIQSNDFLFNQVLVKLDNFDHFLNNECRSLIGSSNGNNFQTTINQLLNPDSYTCFYTQLQFMSAEFKDVVEENERNSYHSMYELVQKMAALLDLLKMTLASADALKTTLEKLDQKSKETLTSLKFADLLSTQNSWFVKKLLQVAIELSCDDPRKSKQISTLSQILFQKDELELFKAQILLESALRCSLRSEEHKKAIKEVMQIFKTVASHKDSCAFEEVNLFQYLHLLLQNGECILAIRLCVWLLHSHQEAKDFLTDLIDAVASSISGREVKTTQETPSFKLFKFVRSQIDVQSKEAKQKYFKNCIDEISNEPTRLQVLLQHYNSQNEQLFCDILILKLNKEQIVTALLSPQTTEMNRNAFDSSVRLFEKQFLFKEQSQLVLKACTDTILVEPIIILSERIKLTKSCLANLKLQKDPQAHFSSIEQRSTNLKQELEQCIETLLSQKKTKDQFIQKQEMTAHSISKGSKKDILHQLDYKFFDMNRQFEFFNEEKLYLCKMKQLMVTKVTTKVERDKLIARVLKNCELHINDTLSYYQKCAKSVTEESTKESKDQKMKAQSYIKDFLIEGFEKNEKVDFQMLQQSRSFALQNFLVQTRPLAVELLKFGTTSYWFLEMIAKDQELKVKFDLPSDVMENFSKIEISQILVYLVALKLWLSQIKQSSDHLEAESRFKEYFQTAQSRLNEIIQWTEAKRLEIEEKNDKCIDLYCKDAKIELKLCMDKFKLKEMSPLLQGNHSIQQESMNVIKGNNSLRLNQSLPRGLFAGCDHMISQNDSFGNEQLRPKTLKQNLNQTYQNMLSSPLMSQSNRKDLSLYDLGLNQQADQKPVSFGDSHSVAFVPPNANIPKNRPFTVAESLVDLQKSSSNARNSNQQQPRQKTSDFEACQLIQE